MSPSSVAGDNNDDDYDDDRSSSNFVDNSVGLCRPICHIQSTYHFPITSIKQYQNIQRG